MASKKLTLILYGADRELWTSGDTELQVNALLVDGGPKNLHAQTLHSHTIGITLNDVRFDAGQLYAVRVEAKRHRPAWQFLKRRTFLRQDGADTVEGDEAILQLMLVPRKARSSDLDSGFEQLARRGSPFVQPLTGLRKTVYRGLQPASKMAFLNVAAKLRGTRVGGQSLESHVTGVRHVAPDRVFLMMRSDAKQLVERSPEFAAAGGHGRPKGVPELPTHPDSWKHRRFGAGNVQLSFAEDAELWPPKKATATLSYSVDVDIDLERGLKHVREWLNNKVFRPGKQTDQTLVYALLYSQGILPAYTLDPLPRPTQKG